MMDDFVYRKESLRTSILSHDKKISLGKIRTENCVSSAKSHNPQEDKLLVLLLLKQNHEKDAIGCSVRLFTL